MQKLTNYEMILEFTVWKFPLSFETTFRSTTTPVRLACTIKAQAPILATILASIGACSDATAPQ
jgi:hypothetical protein